MSLFMSPTEYHMLCEAGAKELWEQYFELFQEEFPTYNLVQFDNIEHYLDCLKTAIDTRIRFVPRNDGLYWARLYEDL